MCMLLFKTLDEMCVCIYVWYISLYKSLGVENSTQNWLLTFERMGGPTLRLGAGQCALARCAQGGRSSLRAVRSKPGPEVPCRATWHLVKESLAQTPFTSEAAWMPQCTSYLKCGSAVSSTKPQWAFCLTQNLCALWEFQKCHWLTKIKG